MIAVRSGEPVVISVNDILVGDVLRIESGNLVCADGVVISGHNLLCDESAVTGVPSLIAKISGDEALSRFEAGKNVDGLDPFIVSGSRVLDGAGTYLVTCVGQHRSYKNVTKTSREENP